MRFAIFGNTFQAKKSCHAQALFDKWNALDKYLLVKYIDGNIKVEKDGKFKDNGYSKTLPEGTRNKTDAPLLPFKKGAFILAKHSGAPIVPVAVKNAVLYSTTQPCAICAILQTSLTDCSIATDGVPKRRSSIKYTCFSSSAF